MADMTVVSANVRALTSHGAVVVPGVAGGTVTIGYLVYQNSSGLWVHADANVSETLAQVTGVAVQSYDGEDTVASGNAVSVCIRGLVGGYTDLNENAVYYLSNTVGRISDAAGAFTRIVGTGMLFAGEIVLNLDIQTSVAASA
jgi:hypothetical protein